MYKIKKEVEYMKNQYIPKKLKLTIILNTMYYRNSVLLLYSCSETLERVGKVLMPNYDVTKFSELLTWYRQTEVNIVRLHNDYMIRLSYIVAYANTHNIKLYSRKYLGL